MEIYTVKLYTSCVRFKKVRNIFVPRCSIALRYSLVFVNGYERIMNGLWMDCKRLWMDLHSVVLYRNFAPSSTDIITVSNWQGEAVSTSKTFKAMKQNRSPTKSAERRLNESVTYRSRIVSVSISYQSRIVLVSSSYRSRFRKRKQYGNDTETIEEAREKQGRMLPTQNIFKFLKLYNYGKTQWYLNQTPGFSR